MTMPALRLRYVARLLRASLIATLAVAAAGCPPETTFNLGKAEPVSDGVQLYRLSDPSLLSPPGAVAVQILRLDPSKVDLQSATAQDRVVALETVPEMAARHHALCAINAGFFVVKNGDPAGVLEVGGELVSDSTLTRGAIGILRRRGQPVRLLFDRVSASVALRYRSGDEEFTVPIDGVDTTRERSKAMLYTPRFGPDSDTASTGVEWQLGGSPLRVLDRRPNAGKTPIPRDGAVLSFGGTVLPTSLEHLDRDQVVALDTRFQTTRGSLPEQWAEAADVVGGAGLLVHKGRALADWSEEKLRQGFNTERHPRTIIGTSKNGTIWLITVDGRNPQVSLGMTFTELQHLAAGLNLVNALNLDGGGSTTMVVNGKIVNHPSDAAGPRKVSDGLIVVPRR